MPARSYLLMSTNLQALTVWDGNTFIEDSFSDGSDRTAVSLCKEPTLTKVELLTQLFRCYFQII